MRSRWLWLALLGLAFLPPRLAQAIDVVALETDFVDGAVGIVNPLDETKGGTGLATYSAGDVIYASGADTLAALAGNAGAKQFLTMASDTPSWAGIVDGDVPDTITIDAATTATNLASDPTDCSANQFANAIDAQADLSCAALVDADIPDTIVINHSSTGTLTMDADDPTTNVGRAAYDSTNGLVWVGAAGGSDTFAPVGTTTDTQFCVWDDAAKEIDCNSGGSGVNSIIYFSSMGTLSAGSTVTYAVPGDVGSAAETQVPTEAATYRNLHCVGEDTPGGSGIVVTLRGGACAATELACTSCPTVTVATANTAVQDASNTLTITDNQCIQLKFAPSSTTTPARVTCSAERSA